MIQNEFLIKIVHTSFFSAFKVGQFFLGIGRLNQTHRHDWPFSNAPLVFRRFFDPDGHGVIDTGGEIGTLLPLPFYLDLSIGVTNGWQFGHSHGGGDKPLFPTHYARLTHYSDIAWGGGLQTGLNYLGRRDNQGEWTTLLGLDTVAKWRENKKLTFLLQNELWYRNQNPRSGKLSKELGFYIYPQYGFNENLYLGLRSDFFTKLSLEDASGNKVSNFTYALVPTLSFLPSEFTRFTFSFVHEESRQAGEHLDTSSYFQVQGVLILGQHPAHDF